MNLGHILGVSARTQAMKRNNQHENIFIRGDFTYTPNFF